MGLRGRTEKVASTLETMQVLVVACGKTYLAIPSAIVRGVVEFGEAVESRIVSLFGEECRVTDLAACLGLPPAVLTPDMRIVLCGERRAHQAWRVDRTLGIEEVDLQRIIPLPPQFAGVERHWFTGLFPFRDVVALLLNPGWLLSQAMDAFVAQTSLEPAAAAQHVLDRGRDAATGDALAASGEPERAGRLVSEAGRRSLRRPAILGEADFLDVLDGLVLEEAKDAEDNQTPWADA